MLNNTPKPSNILKKINQDVDIRIKEFVSLARQYLRGDQKCPSEKKMYTTRA